MTGDSLIPEGGQGSGARVRIERSLTELAGGGRSFGPPKSAAGRRTVIVPEVIAPDLATHIERYVGPDSGDLIFTSPGGEPLHHGNFRRRAWLPAVANARLPDVHLHDLWHAGNAS